MNQQTKAILAELRPSLEAIYGGRFVHMILFGSQARDEAEPGSDIDVLIVLKGPVNPGREIARVSKTTAALSLKHDVVISCTYVSEEQYHTEQSPLLLNIRREGVAA